MPKVWGHGFVKFELVKARSAGGHGIDLGGLVEMFGVVPKIELCLKQRQWSGEEGD